MIRKHVDSALEYLDDKYGSGDNYIGQGKIWNKIKAFAKKAANIVLPKIASIAKDKLPMVIDMIANKFNVGERYSPFVDAAKKVLPGMIPDLTGKVIFSDKEANDIASPSQAAAAIDKLSEPKEVKKAETALKGEFLASEEKKTGTGRRRGTRIKKNSFQVVLLK